MGNRGRVIFMGNGCYDVIGRVVVATVCKILLTCMQDTISTCS